jgi:TonB-linked SusC/RagA family outer membrane protein
MAPYDETNTSGGGWGMQPYGFAGANPLAMHLSQRQINKNYDGSLALIFDWEILKGLYYQGNFSGNAYGYGNEYFQNAWNVGALSAEPEMRKTYGIGQSLRMFHTLTYTNTFAEKHALTAMAGYEVSKSDANYSDVHATGFPSSLLFPESMGLADLTEAGGGRLYPDGENPGAPSYTRGISTFGRLNYAYDEKYMLQAIFRRDGYDRFGPNNKYANYPSFSVGWNIAHEAFIADNVPWISLLKLRSSWGTIGNSNIAQFLYEAYFSKTNAWSGYVLERLPNYGIKPEKVTQTDIGLEMGFFNNRLNLTLETYNKNTTDMLYPTTLSGSSGVVNKIYWTNVGDVNNKGFDIFLQYKDFYRAFNYDVAFTLSRNENKVLKLSDEINPQKKENVGFTEAYITYAGIPMGQMYGYIVDGIFNDQGELDQLNAQAQANGYSCYQYAGTKPGDFKYRDINGADGVPDGRIDENDKTIIGNPWPKFTYGLNLNFEWKGVNLSMGWIGSSKFDILNTALVNERNMSGDNNTTMKVFESWTAENPTSHPRVSSNDLNQNFQQNSTYFIENGAFLKLKTLHLGYFLPRQLISKIGLKNVEIFTNGENLFIFSGVDYDPEIGGWQLGRNNYSGTSVQTKSVAGGISITF